LQLLVLFLSSKKTLMVSKQKEGNHWCPCGNYC
jgi:hypothetical protein